MAIINLPNGIGESAGDTLVTNKPLEINGDVWYVDATTGTDAASPAGQNRSKPLATLSQAITNCADGDIIVCMDGHAETLTSALTIDHDVTIVGAGSSSGKPTVKFTNNQATSGALFTISGGSLGMVTLMNLWIEENSNATANSTPRLNSTVQHLRLRGLYVECSSKDTGAALDHAGGSTSVLIMEDCTFLSTATSTASQPDSAIDLGVSGFVYANGLVLDGGTVGFSNFAAMEFTDVVTQVAMENVSLLRGADIKIINSILGYVNVQTSTGGARVDWCGIDPPS